MGEAYTLSWAGIGQAPESSGVYIIFSRKRWVYVGESDNIRRSLFRHLNGAPPRLSGHGPLSFTFERAAAGDRTARWQAMVTDLKPACQDSLTEARATA
jgi:hypothetical protein